MASKCRSLFCSLWCSSTPAPQSIETRIGIDGCMNMTNQIVMGTNGYFNFKLNQQLYYDHFSYTYLDGDIRPLDF